ncbi:divergent PAP2 family protein [Jeotgalibaca caeni]|uniref:divergent PAP2 family protein n=1 Tax=Jeotgalibaca caeni TaxID=3028623 RepID=UPI00237D71CD|nr:divergent PAP2 family protein [Jeotgalibaca caeni]MDE1549180.1 divergent PAP2 family protein [Jeotgalibaca caeni]
MIIFSNFPLVCSLISIFFTQILKYPIAKLIKDQKTSLSIVTTTGGMPSSHSAGVTALITALILEYGYTSGYVAIATTFGVIVMFDSMGVRRQSGEQGIVLIDMLKELRNLSQHQVKQNKNTEEDYIASPIEERKLILKKYLGHKPLEVFVGILTGIFVAFVVSMIYSRLGII